MSTEQLALKQSQSVELPQLLDTAGLAHRLGVSDRLVRRLVLERRIPFVKVGRFVRFDPHAVAVWLSAHTVEALR
jgi:excisionase family DNA binding protein